MNTDATNKFLLPGAVIIAGLIIAGAVLWNGSHPSTGSPQYGGGFGNAESIDKLNATISGLDAKKIAADVEANKAAYQAAVEADRAEGQKHGVGATPSFIIGTQLIQGAYPYATFQAALDNPFKSVSKPAVDIKNVQMGGSPSIGDPSAPVVMAFWSDFQCPYCKSFEVGGVVGISTPAAFPDIKKNYIDTGKARVVFMDFAFLGPDSLTAALYGRSVWKLYPEKYFAWRTAMYEAQDGENDSK